MSFVAPFIVVDVFVYLFVEQKPPAETVTIIVIVGVCAVAVCEYVIASNQLTRQIICYTNIVSDATTSFNIEWQWRD